MTLHVYTARSQPATRWRDPAAVRYGPRRRHWWHTNKPNRLLWTSCCDRRRPAKNLRVQLYDDEIRVFCSAGKGCKKERRR